MIRTLIQLATAGNATQRQILPDLPHYSRGLPIVTRTACADECSACADGCPTSAIRIQPRGTVSLDRGRCIACSLCTSVCPTGTIAADYRTDVAVTRREDLVLTSRPVEQPASAGKQIWSRSLHVRQVSTGDNATDLEIAAGNNAIFDSSRFGIHYVASPRFADALLVAGPVARAMREPLLRCWEAMAEPRMVIAAGAAAISGVPFDGGYAGADGVDSVLPVSCYIPGNPPHPWYVLHGLLLAMGHPLAVRRGPSRPISRY